MSLRINSQIQIPLSEIETQAIRAQGSGGQNVNKVSSAIHLRFDIENSSLPEAVKVRLKTLADKRITGDGVIIIKAQRFRSQDKNRADALERLRELITQATQVNRTRVPTKPSRASQRRRVDSKTRRGKIKNLRGKVDT